MASSSAGRSFFSFSRSRPWKVRLRSARPLLLIGLQTACLFHVIPTHLFEIRGCEGPSMLPTLSPQGDHLLTVRLPFVRFLEKLQAWGRGEGSEGWGGSGGGAKPWKTRVSKSDPTCGLPLRVGDIVVAASPRNPSRYVCKRIVGLAGDTVLIDPRVQVGGTPDGMDEMAEVIGRSHEDQDEEEHHEHDGSSSSSGDSPLPSSLIVSPVQRRGSDLYVTVPAGHVFLTGDNLSYSNDSRHYGPVPLGCIKGKVVARVSAGAARRGSFVEKLVADLRIDRLFAVVPAMAFLYQVQVAGYDDADAESNRRRGHDLTVDALKPYHQGRPARIP